MGNKTFKKLVAIIILLPFWPVFLLCLVAEYVSYAFMATVDWALDTLNPDKNRWK